MALPPLPQDVLSTIVDAGSFSKHELRMISLASPHLRYEAQRTLFWDPGKHCIDVGANSNEFFIASAFLKAVISSPDRLALMVRRYHVTLSWRDFTGVRNYVDVAEQRNAQDAVFNHLSQALPLMTHLSILQFYTDPRRVFGRPPSITPFLTQCTFRLEVFRFSYIDVGHTVRKLLQAFLLNQSSIRDLWVCEINNSGSHGSQAIEDLDVVRDVCPLVVSVGGTPAFIISMLLAGRRLQHICWKDRWFSSRYRSLQTAHFSSVEFMENFHRGPKLSLICMAFPNLILYKTECRTEVFETPEVLRDLPHLRVLLVVFEPRYLHLFNQFLQNEESYIRRIFSSSLSLQYIEVHNREGGMKYVIDRSIRLITVHVVPASIPLRSGERKDELLQRVPVHIGPKDFFLKRFPL